MTITTDNAPPRPADGKSPGLQRGGALSAGGPAMKVQCQQCGAEFNTSPSQVKNGRGKYCSLPCFWKSRHTTIDKFLSQIERVDSGCWLWTGSMNSSKYGHLSVGGNRILAHRYAYQQLVGQIPNGLCVCHHCDTPLCVNHDHLFLGTVADNNADRDRKGRRNSTRGERHNTAKLTERQVVAIRKRLRSGESQRTVARAFGVSQPAIGYIAIGRNWGWLAE